MKNEKGNLRVISHIAVLILATILVVGSTASWYDRTPTSPGITNKLTYSQTANINNGSDILIETYVGTNDNGIVTYDTTLASSDNIVAEPGAVNYFKTVLTDQSNDGDSIVSLYLKSLTCSNLSDGDIHIGILGPEKTYKSYDGNFVDGKYIVNTICIEDNVLVENNTSTANPKTTEIYWFVETNVSADKKGSLTLGDLYIAAN